MSESQNLLNRAVWSKAESQRWLDGVRTFTDPGEQAALDCVREEIRGTPILDLGVGTGRTIPMLRPLTDDYRALDYVPEMVEICRAKFPGLSVATADARDLSAYPQGYFGFVNFAFNGIDAVPASDRCRVLRSVRGVLRPGGIFVFSTLNIEGPSYRERPWRIRFWPAQNPIRAGWSAITQVASLPLGLTNWLRIRALTEVGPGYAVAPLSAHHFGILAYYTTLLRQIVELEKEGFTNVIAFESRHGVRIAPGDDTSRADWFHFVARRGEQPHSS